MLTKDEYGIVHIQEWDVYKTEWGKIVGLFKYASRLKDKKFRTEREWESDQEENGIKTFKRKALGLCGHNRIVSKDELLRLILETNLAPREEDKKEEMEGALDVLEILVGGKAEEGEYGLKFSEVTNQNEEIRYRISDTRSIFS